MRKQRIRIYFCLLGLAVFSFCLNPGYAAPVRVVVAMPSSVDGTPVSVIVQAFSEQLKKDAPGAEVVLIAFGKDDANDTKQVHEKLSQASANVIVAVGSKLAKSVQTAKLDVPVVFTMVLSPLRNGVSPPGVSLNISYQKKFESFSKMISGFSKVGVLYSEGMKEEVDKVREGCAAVKCEVVAIPVADDKDLPSATNSVMDGIQLFVITPDVKVYFPKAVEEVLQEALKRRVPVLGLSSTYTKAGALISFDCDYPALGQQTAGIVAEVLRGGRPQEVVAPEKIGYSINVQIAKRIGMNIDDSWVKGAQEVFGR